ncbi:MAG: transcriptional regulator [Lysobacteraceae bacterium]|nr:MAG: transcriptional regulator [Xanthomonadaceae bacterium]
MRVRQGENMFKCFEEGFDISRLDREPFKFNHQLLSHPALAMDSLSRSLPQLPADRIMYSKGLSDLGINFDRAHIEHGNGKTLEQTIETIRTSSSYIAVRDPEDHPSFRELYQDLVDDVGRLMRGNGRARRAITPRMWMFIASPGAQTPFHFDRYSNFLMQIRGSKQVAVFPNFESSIVPPHECESYMDRAEAKPLWKPEFDRHATKFDFSPGEAIHIPYIAGHYVKNGMEDVSISLSFFFQTEQTRRWTNAMRFNHRVRPHLARVGMVPTPVGHRSSRDAAKALMLRVMDKGRSWRLRLSGAKQGCMGMLNAGLALAVI